MGYSQAQLSGVFLDALAISGITHPKLHNPKSEKAVTRIKDTIAHIYNKNGNQTSDHVVHARPHVVAKAWAFLRMLLASPRRAQQGVSPEGG